MTERILFVDDDANLLEGLKRHLRRCYHIDTATSGQQAIELVQKGDPYTVIVSDMRMPAMDGVQFLATMQRISPQAVRVMLTGCADQQTAIDAVNEGHVFRFLTKPCSAETLGKVLDAAIAQYRLVTAEADLLQRTLAGSIAVIVEILSMATPDVFGTAMRVRRYVRQIAQALNASDIWRLELAAMFARIGQVAIPTEIVSPAAPDRALSPQEQSMLQRVPEIGRNLLLKIPRLETVAEIVLYQDKQFEGNGFPEDDVRGKAIPLGARILKLASDIIILEDVGTPAPVIVRIIRARKGWYDPELVEIALGAIESVPGDRGADASQPGAESEANAVARAIERAKLGRLGALRSANAHGSASTPGIPTDLHHLCAGAHVVKDILCEDGTLLLAAGNIVTDLTLERLRNIAAVKPIRHPIFVTPQKHTEKGTVGSG